MLRDVALRGADGFDDILYTDLGVAEHAQNLQPQRVRDGLQRAGGSLDVFVPIDEREDVVLDHNVLRENKAISIKYGATDWRV